MKIQSDVEYRDIFSRQGYLLVRNAVQPELIKNLQYRLKQFISAYYARVNGLSQVAANPSREELDAMVIELYHLGKAHTSYLFDALVNIAEVYQIALSPKVMGLVHECFAGRPDTSFTIKNVGIRMDIPELNWSEDFPWHQDYPYNKPFSTMHSSGTVWIPIFDCPQDVGPVLVEQSSHLRGEMQSSLDYKRGEHRNPLHVLKESDIDPNNVRQFPMQAGDLLIFDLLTAHSSGKNVSGNMLRWTLIARYFDINADGFLQERCPVSGPAT